MTVTWSIIPPDNQTGNMKMTESMRKYMLDQHYKWAKSVEHLRYEAKAIEKLISNETIPLGSVDRGRIRYISDLYNEYGSSVKSFNINNFI